jgi:hypothetical protein
LMISSSHTEFGFLGLLWAWIYIHIVAPGGY